MDSQNQNQQQFCLKWNSFGTNLINASFNLFQSETLADVTLFCDGVTFKAHKLILAACSKHLATLFNYFNQSNQSTINQPLINQSLNTSATSGINQQPINHVNQSMMHPNQSMMNNQSLIIIMDQRITAKNMSQLLEFMYKGEINVRQTDLFQLLKSAELLQIKGLSIEHNQHKINQEASDLPPSPTSWYNNNGASTIQPSSTSSPQPAAAVVPPAVPAPSPATMLSPPPPSPSPSSSTYSSSMMPPPPSAHPPPPSLTPSSYYHRSTSYYDDRHLSNDAKTPPTPSSPSLTPSPLPTDDDELLMKHQHHPRKRSSSSSNDLLLNNRASVLRNNNNNNGTNKKQRGTASDCDERILSDNVRSSPIQLQRPSSQDGNGGSGGGTSAASSNTLAASASPQLPHHLPLLLHHHLPQQPQQSSNDELIYDSATGSGPGIGTAAAADEIDGCGPEDLRMKLEEPSVSSLLPSVIYQQHSINNDNGDNNDPISDQKWHNSNNNAVNQLLRETNGNIVRNISDVGGSGGATSTITMAGPGTEGITTSTRGNSGRPIGVGLQVRGAMGMGTVTTVTVGGGATKKLKCPYCERLYGYETNLRAHIRQRHQGIRVPCPYCNRTFTRNNTVRRHIAREHKSECGSAISGGAGSHMGTGSIVGGSALSGGTLKQQQQQQQQQQAQQQQQQQHQQYHHQHQFHHQPYHP